MILTVTDVGMARFRLCGPPSTMQFVEAMRFFVARQDLCLNIREFHGGQSQSLFQDDNISVVPIVVYADGHSAPALPTAADAAAEIRGRVACQIEPNAGNSHDYTVFLRTQHFQQRDAAAEGSKAPSSSQTATSSGQLHGLKPARKTKQFHKHMPWTSFVDSVVCYAVHTPDIPGKFDAKMADKLGVKPNMRNRLVKGEDVVVEGGRVVKPSECISPSTPGSVVIIVHVPSPSYLNSFLNDHEQKWKHYQASAATKLVVHMSPREVVVAPAYQAWMASFALPGVQHWIFNEDYCPQSAVFQSSAVNLSKLHLLDNAVFRTPFSTEQPSVDIRTDFPSQSILAGCPLDAFHLAPLNSLGLDKSEALKPLQPIVNAALHKLLDPTVNSEFVSAFNALQQLQLEQTTPNQGFEVVCLGTGAALPSKYRNVSSTYLHVDGQGGLLFDAGEGSFGQLFRRYGPAEIASIIRGLKCVFISHMHADHHLGLLRILGLRSKVHREAEPTRALDLTLLLRWPTWSLLLLLLPQLMTSG